MLIAEFIKIALLIFILFIHEASTQTECTDNPTLCMLELLGGWENANIKEINSTKVLLPILYYSKVTLMSLCETYNKVYNNCNLKSCDPEHQLIKFVNSHFSYICSDEVGLKYIDTHECVSTELIAANCSNFINETPLIGGDLHCDKIEQFGKCSEVAVNKCGQGAIDIINSVMLNYGCVNGQTTSTASTSTTISMTDSPPPTTTTTTTTTTGATTPTTTPTTTPMTTPSTTQSTSTTTSPSTTISTTMNPTTTTTTAATTTTPKTTSSVDSTPNETTVPPSGSLSEQSDDLVADNLVTDTTTAATTTTSTTTRPSLRKRRKFRADNMTDCYSAIMSDFGRLLQASPSTSFIRFPLYGVKPMEVDALCSKYEWTNDCVSSFCVGNCRFPPIKTFVDSQLEAVCQMRTSDSFEMEFSCLQNTMAENEECVQFVNSSNPNVCVGHHEFHECLADRLLTECSEDSLNMLTNLQKGLGCKLLLVDDADDEIKESSGVHSDALEGSGQEGSGFDESEMQRLSDKKEVKRPRTCVDEVKTGALSCIVPLLKLWSGIKANRRETEVVFPIFRFSKIELLELCDAFVNYRVCMDYRQTQVCRSLPIIEFAEQHFSEACSITAITATIKTYDCINSLDFKHLQECNKFTRGESVPGKKRCTKVRRHTQCIRKLVEQECGPLILAHYDHIVDSFGC